MRVYALLRSYFFQTEKDSAISDCTKAIELNSSYVKAYIRRAQLYEETEKLDEALEDFKKVLTFDSSHTEANHAIRVMYNYLFKIYDSLQRNLAHNKDEFFKETLKILGYLSNNYKKE